MVVKLLIAFVLALMASIGRFFHRLARKDSGLPAEVRFTLRGWAFQLTPLCGGAIQPGPFNAASVKCERTVTSDKASLLGAATGRRLLGYEISTANQTAAGAILKGASTVLDSTNLLSSFTLRCDDKHSKWYGPNGIDAELGITVDFQAGSFDVILYYLDAP